MLKKFFDHLISYIRRTDQFLLGTKIGIATFLISWLGLTISTRLAVIDVGGMFRKTNVYFWWAFLSFGFSLVGMVGMVRKEFGQGLKLYTGRTAFKIALTFFLAAFLFGCYWIWKIITIIQ